MCIRDSPSFLTLRNLFDLFRTMIVTGIFACGVMMIIINGGIDMSFMAIAICSAYMTVRLATSPVSYTHLCHNVGIPGKPLYFPVQAVWLWPDGRMDWHVYGLDHPRRHFYLEIFEREMDVS